MESHIKNLSGEGGGMFLSEAGTATYEQGTARNMRRPITFFEAWGEVTLDVCVGNIEGAEGRTLTDGQRLAGIFTKITVSGTGELLVIRDPA